MGMTKRGKLNIFNKVYAEDELADLERDISESLDNPYIKSSGKYHVTVTYEGDHSFGAPFIEVGDEFETTHGKILILEYQEAAKVYIEFLNTGTKIYTSTDSIRKGRTKDPFVPSVCGVGYHGIPEKGQCIDHRTKAGRDKALNIWSSMLDRCYNPSSPSYSRYGAKGVRVCDEWHNLQSFREWFVPNYRAGFQIDKDLRDLSVKIYSPETCEFIPNDVNSFLAYSPSKRDLPMGVRENQRGNIKNYKTQLTMRGTTVGLGHYDTIDEAFQVYKAAKEEYIKEVAQEHYDQGNISKQIYNTLMNWEIVPFPD